MIPHTTAKFHMTIFILVTEGHRECHVMSRWSIADSIITF